MPAASREVEDALCTHPPVAGAAVVGTPDEKWIEAVTAFVVPAAGVNVERLEEEPVGHVRGRLAAFKVPGAVRPVADLPRNASGEILKRGPRGG